MKKNKIFAFSLAEVLIVLGLLGVVASMLMPTIQSIQPNQNKILLRKGYNVVERTVNLLINDDELYPGADAFAEADSGGAYVFCKNFQDSLNVISVGECPSSGGPVFIGSTPDGIAWYFTAGEFTKNADAYNNFIFFDVNGTEKLPNCSSNSVPLPGGYNTCTKDQKPDLFKVGIRWDGKLHLGGSSAEYDEYATNVLNNVTNNMND